MTEKYPVRICKELVLQRSCLIVAWSEDAGKLGPKVTDYLNTKLGCQEFGEIEPDDFFPLGGVSIEDNIAQFPESKFYCCQEKNLVIFKSSPPVSEWYRFLDSVLGVAEDYCHAKELYAVGGMVTLNAHTAPRELLAVVNSPEIKSVLSQCDLNTGMDYQTPLGQRPTLSSFLLWVAKRRNIAGASLRVPIPFYLVTAEDPQACRKILDFFDKRFNLGVDFSDLDEEVARQNDRIAQIRVRSPEVDNYIRKLENNVGLTQEENEKLVKEIEEFLITRD